MYSPDHKQKWRTKVVVVRYGALGNKYFPLFNNDIAGAITGNGRFFIQKLANYIEKSLQDMHPSEKEYIVYGDTDSVYYHIEPFVEMYKSKNPDLSVNQYVDWADAFEIKVIQPIIEKTINDFAKELNAFDKDVIGAEREIISDAAVFTAKKKYYARVRDSEGTRFPENDPYIKVMGLEIIKSTTPNWSKEKLKQAIPLILDKNENDLKLWVNQIKQEFIETSLVNIAQGGGVSNLQYDLKTDKGIPIGSRAGLIHNQYIKDNNLEGKYTPIQAGDKCKRLYLIEPNKFHSNIVAYTNDQFVEELDCVDYDTNFEKSFLKPLQLMIEALNWDLTQETAVIDDW